MVTKAAWPAQGMDASGGAASAASPRRQMVGDLVDYPIAIVHVHCLQPPFFPWLTNGVRPRDSKKKPGSSTRFEVAVPSVPFAFTTTIRSVEGIAEAEKVVDVRLHAVGDNLLQFFIELLLQFSVVVTKSRLTPAPQRLLHPFMMIWMLAVIAPCSSSVISSVSLRDVGIVDL